MRFLTVRALILILAVLATGSLVLAEDPKDPVEQLPPEVATHILEYLDAEDFSNADLVSKEWNSLTRSGYLLKERWVKIVDSCGNKLKEIDKTRDNFHITLFLIQYKILRLSMLEDYPFYAALAPEPKASFVERFKNSLNAYYSELCAKLPELANKIKASQKEQAGNPLLCARKVLDLIEIRNFLKNIPRYQFNGTETIGKYINTLKQCGLEEQRAWQVLPSIIPGLAASQWDNPKFSEFSSAFADYLINEDISIDSLSNILRGIELDYRKHLLLATIERLRFPQEFYKQLITFANQAYDQNPKDPINFDIAAIMARKTTLAQDPEAQQFIARAIEGLREGSPSLETFSELVTGYQGEDWKPFVQCAQRKVNLRFHEKIIRAMLRRPHPTQEQYKELIELANQAYTQHSKDPINYDIASAMASNTTLVQDPAAQQFIARTIEDLREGSPSLGAFSTLLSGYQGEDWSPFIQCAQRTNDLLFHGKIIIAMLTRPELSQKDYDYVFSQWDEDREHKHCALLSQNWANSHRMCMWPVIFMNTVHKHNNTDFSFFIQKLESLAEKYNQDFSTKTSSTNSDFYSQMQGCFVRLLYNPYLPLDSYPRIIDLINKIQDESLKHAIILESFLFSDQEANLDSFYTRICQQPEHAEEFRQKLFEAVELTSDYSLKAKLLAKLVTHHGVNAPLSLRDIANEIKEYRYRCWFACDVIRNLSSLPM